MSGVWRHRPTDRHRDSGLLAILKRRRDRELPEAVSLGDGVEPPAPLAADDPLREGVLVAARRLVSATQRGA